MTTPIEEVVSPTYRSVVKVIALTASVIAAFFVAQDRAAAFVDERVRIKTEVADKLMDAQTRRLEKLDARMDSVQANMLDIKVDLAKVRALLEERHGRAGDR